MPMQFAKIRKQGGSSIITIPSQLMSEVNLGVRVLVSTEDGAIVIRAETETTKAINIAVSERLKGSQK